MAPALPADNITFDYTDCTISETVVLFLRHRPFLLRFWFWAFATWRTSKATHQ